MFRKTLSIAIVLIFATIYFLAPNDDSTIGSAGLGDLMYPDLGNGGYDVQHYDLTLSWDDQTNEVDATAIITAQAIQNLSRFNLDFLGMTVHSVLVNGELATFERDQRELIITPPDLLNEDELFLIVVNYAGVPEPDSNSGAGTPRGWNRTTNGVFVVSEPSGASTWFPCNDHPQDKASYTLRITVPSEYTVAATGLLSEQRNLGDETVYVWETDSLVASYLVTVNIDSFVRFETQPVGDVQIRNYFPQNNLLESNIQQAAILPEAIHSFSNVIAPYPFEAFGIAVVDTFPRANEMQTLAVLGQGAVSERVIVHELAHQWFGNSVSPMYWEDLWLNEGFASYGEQLWVEQHYGSEYISPMLTEQGYQSLRGMIALVPPPRENIFHRSIYVRGAWTLHALRLRVGDSIFFEILQTYYETYQDSVASTSDFIEVAESVSRQDLSAFFDGWIYAEDIPDVPELGYTMN